MEFFLSEHSGFALVAFCALLAQGVPLNAIGPIPPSKKFQFFFNLLVKNSEA